MQKEWDNQSMAKGTSLGSRLFNIKKLRSFAPWQKIILPLLLLLVGNFYTYYSITHKNYPSLFYQNEFAPAVMFACGNEFANSVSVNSSLQSFLDNKTSSFECKNLAPVHATALNYFQSLERYMILSAGILWKILGVDWNHVIPLFLILYSMSLLATYSIFRLGMNPFLSFFFSLFIAFSFLQMYYVTQLRDYSVAPFLLGVVWILGKLVLTPPNRKQLLQFSILSGLYLGLGLGFRIDLLVILPFFLITVLFFIKGGKKAFQNKLAAIILFLIGFFTAGFPVLYALHHHGGGDLAHIIILGLADSFTPNLGLGQPEAYSVIPAYRDLIPFTAVNSFSQRIYGIEGLIPTATKNYSYYSTLFLLNYLSTFPADFLVRIYASLLQVPLIFIHGFWYHVFNSIPLRNIIAILPFVVAATIAFFQLRKALFLLFALLYLGTYPVLQFDPRHYFYLEFVGLWFIGFLCQQCIFLVRNKSNRALFAEIKSKVLSRWKTISVTAVMSFALLSILIISLRFYQENHLNKLFNHYLDAKTQTINPILNEKEKQYTIKLPLKNNDLKSSYLDTVYLKIQSKEKCPLNQISLKLHYLEKPLVFGNTDDTLTIPTDKATTYFLPIYNFHNGSGNDILDEAFLPSYWVDSLEYSSTDAHCIQEVAYLKDIKNIPLLLTLKLQTGWEKTKLYQYFQKI